MTLSLRFLHCVLLFVCLVAPLQPLRHFRKDSQGAAAEGKKGICPGEKGDVPISQGPSYPVILVLAHYGSRQSNWNSRRATRRSHTRRLARSKSGWYTITAVIYYVQPHQMPTRRTPIAMLLSSLTQAKANSNGPKWFEFLGGGLYLLIVLLRSADIELNPGPFNAADKEYLDRLFDVKLENANKKLTDLSQKVDNIAEKVAEDAKEVAKLSERNTALQERVETLEQRLGSLELQQRKKNIIAFGIPDDKNIEVLEFLQDLFVKTLLLKDYKVNEFVEAAFRFGKSKTRRPVLIKFSSEKEKQKVMQYASRLKDTQISFTDDLSPEERKQRKIIVAAQKEAKKLGIQGKVRRAGLLVGKNILSHKTLCRAGWAEKLLHKRKNSTADESVVQDSEAETEVDLEDANPKNKRKRPNSDQRSQQSYDDQQASTSQASTSQAGLNFLAMGLAPPITPSAQQEKPKEAAKLRPRLNSK